MPSLTDENKLWYVRGMYLGAMVRAVRQLVAEVDPTPEERAALQVTFRTEHPEAPEGAAGVVAWHQWREERIHARTLAMRELTDRVERECYGPEPPGGSRPQ